MLCPCLYLVCTSSAALPPRWRDPALSGLVLGSGLVLLLAVSSYSLISVVAYLGLSLLLVGLGAQLYVHLMGLLKKPCKAPLASVATLELAVTEEQVAAVTGRATEGLNTAVSAVRSLILAENYLDTAKFGLILYTATFLGALANTLTLVTISWVAAFTLPTVYDAKKKEIDGAVAAAMEHYSCLNAKVAALLPATPTPKQE